MKIKCLFYCLLVITSFSIKREIYAADLQLVIPQFPPYTNEENKIFTGVGIDLISIVMKDIGVDYKLRSTPNYARALNEVKHGRADGFFLASENSQRNEVAVFSEPLLINKWSWFFASDRSLNPKSKSFKSIAKVATIHGSNTYKWLKKHNYNITIKSNSARLFPMLLLDKKRIDAAFLASEVFNAELNVQGYSERDYIEIVEKATPFGIYISKGYLREKPDFMKKLNKAILKVQDLK